ncbi:hypothetical protein QJS66_18430 [Kocuria rhizophila]|nr:hypothetical protein QJS66_18430 [Kocuria rhizophila]
MLGVLRNHRLRDGHRGPQTPHRPGRALVGRVPRPRCTRPDVAHPHRPAWTRLARHRPLAGLRGVRPPLPRRRRGGPAGNQTRPLPPGPGGHTAGRTERRRDRGRPRTRPAAGGPRARRTPPSTLVDFAARGLERQPASIPGSVAVPLAAAHRRCGRCPRAPRVTSSCTARPGCAPRRPSRPCARHALRRTTSSTWTVVSSRGSRTCTSQPALLSSAGATRRECSCAPLPHLTSLAHRQHRPSTQKKRRRYCRLTDW